MLKLVLALLQLANLFMDWSRTEKDRKAGADEEVARAALAVLQKTEHGKKIAERIDALGEQELGNLIDQLASRGVRPVPGNNPKSN